MRVEPYSVDSYLHILKRGARGMVITKDLKDKWRFVRLLYYLNDHYKNDFWERDTKDKGLFERPENWPERKPLVSIMAWVLMPNHFHLILKETEEGGISKFMQKLCGSMSVHFNFKYKEKGSLFQGAYKGRTIGEDDYLRRLAPYIMVKNVFELYPGGYDLAVKEFEKSWTWALSYPFSSLADYATERESLILDKDILGEIFELPVDFKELAKDMILSRSSDLDDELKMIILE